MKVGIVGTGRVGSTAAYALVLTGAAAERDALGRSADLLRRARG